MEFDKSKSTKFESGLGKTGKKGKRPKEVVWEFGSER